MKVEICKFKTFARGTQFFLRIVDRPDKPLITSTKWTKEERVRKFAASYGYNVVGSEK